MERIKVLVVDDSRVSCAMLSNMMAKTNFEVCGMASNCADAVLKYESLRPMAVTMDMNLPDADGIECSRRIREIDPDARIVMISAMKDASLMERGREVGITSFLQKPVSPYELIDALSCIVSDDIKRNTSIRDLYIQSFSKVLRQSLSSPISSSQTIVVALISTEDSQCLFILIFIMNMLPISWVITFTSLKGSEKIIFAAGRSTLILYSLYGFLL